jgi:hypothetical protein
MLRSVDLCDLLLYNSVMKKFSDFGFRVKMKVPGIIDLELVREGKRAEMTLSYKGHSKTVSLYDLWLDELAKVFRDLADWLDELVKEGS